MKMIECRIGIEQWWKLKFFDSIFWFNNTPFIIIIFGANNVFVVWMEWRNNNSHSNDLYVMKEKQWQHQYDELLSVSHLLNFRVNICCCLWLVVWFVANWTSFSISMSIISISVIIGDMWCDIYSERKYKRCLQHWMKTFKCISVNNNKWAMTTQKVIKTNEQIIITIINLPNTMINL